MGKPQLSQQITTCLYLGCLILLKRVLVFFGHSSLSVLCFSNFQPRVYYCGSVEVQQAVVYVSNFSFNYIKLPANYTWHCLLFQLCPWSFFIKNFRKKITYTFRALTSLIHLHRKTVWMPSTAKEASTPATLMEYLWRTDHHGNTFGHLLSAFRPIVFIHIINRSTVRARNTKDRIRQRLSVQIITANQATQQARASSVDGTRLIVCGMGVALMRKASAAIILQCHISFKIWGQLRPNHWRSGFVLINTQTMKTLAWKSSNFTSDEHHKKSFLWLESNTNLLCSSPRNRGHGNVFFFVRLKLEQTENSTKPTSTCWCRFVFG